MRMGATNDMSPVDIDKFGQDLEAVVKKISALEPSVVVTSDLSGEKPNHFCCEEVRSKIICAC